MDGRADIYALGCVLYYTLTGSVPYPRESDSQSSWRTSTRPRPPQRHNPTLAAFDPVLARAMAKRPEHRYGSASDLSRDLTEAVGAYRSHDRPSRIVTEPTVPPREPSSYGAASDVVRAPEPVGQAGPPAPPSSIRGREPRRRARRGGARRSSSSRWPSPWPPRSP